MSEIQETRFQLQNVPLDQRVFCFALTCNLYSQEQTASPNIRAWRVKVNTVDDSSYRLNFDLGKN
jgi:hypothetical protein